MYTLMKYGLRSCFGLIFVSTMLDVSCGAAANRTKINNCKREVGIFCSSDANTCREYCKGKKIKACECNTNDGECMFYTGADATQNDNELQKLNYDRFLACTKEEGTQKNWQKVTTIDWLILTENKVAKPRPGELNVRDAVKKCEKLVNDECVNIHAPKYCSVKDIQDCQAQRICGIKSRTIDGEATEDAEGRSTSQYKIEDPELQAQVKAQLMACIAAYRDPKARKTGRPEYEGCSTKTPIPWCAINSPSWRDKILWPESAKVIKARKDAYNEKVRQAKEEGKDEMWIGKNIDFPMTRGQSAEESIRIDICENGALADDCSSPDRLVDVPKYGESVNDSDH